MGRACLGFILTSCITVTLGSAPASAQTVIGALTQDGPSPGFERTALVNQQTPVGNLANAWLGFGSWVERGAPEWSLNGSSLGASWIDDTHIGVIDTPKGPKGVIIDAADPRVAVTYPSSDQRVVAVYVHAASSGKEVPLLRIVYTRRP